MKIFALIYIGITAVLSLTSALLQIQPALLLIELLTFDNKFSMTLVWLLTFLLLCIPLVIILWIKKLSNRKKNEMPDLIGKTGIIVHRRKALQSAIYDTGVLINGELKSSVSNGKSTFIELPWANYTVAIKGRKDTILEVKVPKREIIELEFSYIDDGGLKVRAQLIQLEK